MMRIFVTTDQKLVESNSFTSGCWVHLVNPTEKEKKRIIKKFKFERDAIDYPLDFAEKPRIEEENKHKLIILRTPFFDKEGGTLRTIPLGVLFVKGAIITISSEDISLFDEFKGGKSVEFYTNKRTRFLFQIFRRVMQDYITQLDRIEDELEVLEDRMLESPKNEGLRNILEKRKTLIYFNKALVANGRVLETLLGGKVIKLFEEDKDLLEDVIIENEQALDMSSTLINVLTSTTDVYSSLIDNNLNSVMKLLTAVTIILSIPALVGSFWGMNIRVPFATSPDGFAITLGLALILAIATALGLYKMDWL